MKSDNYCILCTDQKNLQNNSTKVWLTLFKPHRIRLSLADKRNLKKPNRNTGLGNLSIYYKWKNIKSAYKKKINLKFLLQLGMILLICLMVLILLQTFKIILNLSSKNMKL